MFDPIDAPVGCILAGGLSTRLGGGDKSLADCGGRPLLARVIDRFAPQVGPLIINANGNPARFSAFGRTVVPDTIAGHPGPLAGILAALDWTAENVPDASYVVTAAADTPFFPEILVEALRDQLSGPDMIVTAASEAGRHPVFGLFPMSLRADLRAFLAEGSTRKVTAWIDTHRVATVHFPPLRLADTVIDPFFNVNSPADLDVARSMAALMASRAGAV